VTSTSQTLEALVELPTGLEETIKAFTDGCTEKTKTVSKDVRLKMIEKLERDFKTWQEIWKDVKGQVLAVAGLSGRLAALYAELDGKKKEVEWKHARQGLRDGQAECRSNRPERAKHCETADFETD
jgi:hypothetical protein